MEKRYQVFVSSTYADLKEERRKVIQTLMEMDCIPSGMEIFPAADEEQWKFIKKIISDCDYYILIIGGRYGSITSEGISYTEKEYEYAASLGIKVLAFLHEKPDEIPVKNSEIDPVLRGKLESFRRQVSKGRLVKFWNRAEELPGLVSLSLSKTIMTYPAVGWVRANIIANAELLNEVNNLRKRNDELEQLIGQLGLLSTPASLNNLAGLDDEIMLSGTYTTKSSSASYNNKHQYDRHEWEYKISWGNLFALIAPYMLEHPNDIVVKMTLEKSVFEKMGKSGESVSINDQMYQTVKIQLIALGLVEIRYIQTTTGGMALFWSLTKIGQEQLFRFRTVKKENVV
jgi:hypothetical protein